jgi:aminoglycoside/choline kinase family phosphotransferase
VGEEYGFAGAVLRGRLRYADGAAASLVAKRGDRDERAVREERFYREVGATFAPRFLGARDGVLLLEDVRGRQGDVLAGCSIEEAGAVLERLAPFHAARWGAAAAATGFPVWYGDPRARQERYAACVDAFLEHEGAGLPSSARAIVEELRTRLAAVAAELATGPRTLIHGDLHLDNVLFAAGDRPVVVLDWQAAAIGPPAWDVALFLYGSLEVEPRRAAEEELLGRYATALGVPGYSVEELARDCALALQLQLAGAVAWLAKPEREGATARERDVRRAALADGRLLSAVLDRAEGVVRPGA